MDQKIKLNLRDTTKDCCDALRVHARQIVNSLSQEHSRITHLSTLQAVPDVDTIYPCIFRYASATPAYHKCIYCGSTVVINQLSARTCIKKLRFLPAYFVSCCDACNLIIM